MINTKGHRYPKDLISYAVLIYASYKLSLKEVTEFLLMRGINVSRQTVHDWVQKFGPIIAANLKKKVTSRRWHCDETYMKCGGKWVYFYRAMDENMDLVDIYVSSKRNKSATRHFFQKCIHIKENVYPESIRTDGHQSYNQIRTLFPDARHHQVKCLNNKAESSHVPVKQRYRPMRGFKKMKSMNRFLKTFESIYCFFRQFKSTNRKQRQHFFKQFTQFSLVSQPC